MKKIVFAAATVFFISMSSAAQENRNVVKETVVETTVVKDNESVKTIVVEDVNEEISTVVVEGTTDREQHSKEAVVDSKDAVKKSVSVDENTSNIKAVQTLKEKEKQKLDQSIEQTKEAARATLRE